ncbi:MAG: EamA family transporter [Bacteroidota bacterium]
MPNRSLVIACFACTYIIWGSTYLAVKLVISEAPLFMSIGSRFFVAGLLLYLYTLLLSLPRPTLREWGNATFLGFLFMSVGTGAVAWAVQYVDTGITALIISAEPLVILLTVWLLFGQRPLGRSIAGVVLGIIGIMLLVSQNGIGNAESSYYGVAAILTAMIGWAIASIYSPTADLPDNKARASSMQMLMGGGILILIGLLNGEGQQVNYMDWSLSAWSAWVFLVIFGSLIAFSAFNYLLQYLPPEQVATSTYVNPIVALFLGWWILGEVITTQSLIACAVLITRVIFVNTTKKDPQLRRLQQERILRWKTKLGGLLRTSHKKY